MQTEEGLSAQVHLFESAFAGVMCALPGHRPSQADDRRPGLSWQLSMGGSCHTKRSSSYTLVTKITVIKGSKRRETASFSQFNYRTGGHI